MNILIRKEMPEDYAQVATIIELAFGKKSEAILVENLRKNPLFIPDLSLVAETQKSIVGHILFFPIKIKYHDQQSESLALAPLSVVPEYQKRGIGKQLIREGLVIAKNLGHTSVIVIGHADYYPKLGFKPARTWNIKAPFEIPDDVFFAIELGKDSLKDVHGMVEYPKEFNHV